MNTHIITLSGKKMNSRYVYLALLMALLSAGCSRPAVPAASATASAADLAAIRQTASDYIDGWYTGDAIRMERALYDQLSKRWVTDDSVDTTSKWEMIDMTKAGGGKGSAGVKKNTVTIMEVYGNIAMVKTDSADYVDYLQMGKVKGKWIIINVLWAEKQP